MLMFTVPTRTNKPVLQGDMLEMQKGLEATIHEQGQQIRELREAIELLANGLSPKDTI